MVQVVYKILCIVPYIFFASTVFAQENSGRIYGTVELSNEQKYEGRITWTDSKALWNNRFVGLDRSRTQYAPPQTQPRGFFNFGEPFDIMFGYIVSITKLDRSNIIILKDKREITAFEVDSHREGDITILDLDAGSVKVPLNELKKVKFSDEPKSYSNRIDEKVYPLYGTVNTFENMSLNGYIQWGGNRNLSVHSLRITEGRDVREIAFDQVGVVKSLGRRGYEITLLNGKKLYSRSFENRWGVIVIDKRFGRVEVNWDEISEVAFIQNAPGIPYSDFKAGVPIRGTLIDTSGVEHTGYVRWDNHEQMTTDELDGSISRGITFYIEFRNISEIKRRTYSSAIVRLKSGEELTLRNSIDVDAHNRGIFILNKPDDKEGKVFTWNEFDRLIIKN